MRPITLAVLVLGLVLARFGSSSEGFDDVLKMTKAGVGEDLLLSFVDQSAVAYELTTDEIILLRDLGASEKVIIAMLAKGKAARAEAKEREAARAEPPPEPRPV